MNSSVESILQNIGHVQNIIAALMATGAAVSYNFLKHKHDKDIFKRELFFRLNERYEKIRDGLDNILSWEISFDFPQDIPGPSLQEEIDLTFGGGWGLPTEKFGPIYRYLALCSEQFYWYKKGYIEFQVWKSWHDAMIQWHSSSLIMRTVVLNECESKVTYYNQEFLDLFSKKNSA